MASFFNVATTNVDTGPVTLLTSNSDSTIILSILAANTVGSSAVDCTVSVNTGATIVNYIGYTVPVPADSNVDFIANKYILPSGNSIRVSASTSGQLDAAISYVVV
jgi:hypothetical protein